MLLVALQMYVMMDALADGGVYAGIPKELALKLIAYTMMVRLHNHVCYLVSGTQPFSPLKLISESGGGFQDY